MTHLSIGPSSGRTVLVTGGAGFIGSHVCEKLLSRGDRVLAVDNFDPFYDPAIKRRNIARAFEAPSYRLIEADILDGDRIAHALEGESIDIVVHLAARPGVRPSLENPQSYIESNVTGTVSMLELARSLTVRGFVFGSSSSVYGDAAPVPFHEDYPAASPISPYAASKRAGELLCHTYHHLYGLPITCLRFFTVYGPRQRPDLAIHKFTRLMMRGEEIPFYGSGATERDYTYVDDIVQGVEGALEYVTQHPEAFEIINLGESHTTRLSDLVEMIARELGVEPQLRFLPSQPGDVARTYASVAKARELLGYRPSTPIEEGIRHFVAWVRETAESEVASRSN